MIGKSSLYLILDIHSGQLWTSEQVLSIEGVDSVTLEGIFFFPIYTLLSLCTLIKIGVLEKENMNSEYNNKLYPCLRWI